MNIKHLFGMSLLMISVSSVWAAPVEYTASSPHKGNVQGNGVDWDCNGSLCKATAGNGGNEADMRACQALAKQVGPLGSFHSNAGTDWSPSKNSNRMAFCNSAVAFK